LKAGHDRELNDMLLPGTERSLGLNWNKLEPLTLVGGHLC
jgi:hypothetical protein